MSIKFGVPEEVRIANAMHYDRSVPNRKDMSIEKSHSSTVNHETPIVMFLCYWHTKEPAATCHGLYNIKRPGREE